ncbi:TPA: exo-alpha-sialidase [Candidatus Poribacteria bacterium]|nr:exo-alpha-sialidase [Candidatus Poribacteria bacterium]HIA67530.1 exo-alpha-sialidase [Candidatus Poribacteria bacterium]HIB87679.1 exo-alpha-sialidase [Candidatus Poribacteria bacterium]HIB99282.1 exo-alpha-sialidase [Candidatus Poribacteria bacterium]HIN28189.1 exo-alpha-sialidase [Candidatus Poribacteria bacterium]
MMSNIPMTRPEEVLAVHQTNYFHSSTFVELIDQRILHAAGTTFSISDDRGLSWSKPFSCEDADGNSVGGSGTSLVKLSENGIGLAAIQKPSEGSSKTRRGSCIVFWRSEDSGETWESPVTVTPSGLNTYSYQDVLLRTSSGRIILPVYISLGQAAGLRDLKPPASGKLVNGHWVSTAAHFFDPHFSASYVCYSDDDGRTWQRNQDGELIILLDWNATYSYTNEPTVTEVEPGRLLMFMRNGLGRIFQAWSEDNGQTWTRPQPTSLASSTAPAQIRTLPTGHLLAVWNQESPEEIQRGYNRTRISSAISRNGGSVWEFFQNVESMHEETRIEPAPIQPVRPAEFHFDPGIPAPERQREHIMSVEFHGRWSYPSVFVMADRVLIAHTYSVYEEHPTRAELILSSRKEARFNQKLKVLPLNWFYGGKEPADNPFLPRANDPATP